VPKNRPGRGLSLAKLHFLAAVPRVDGIRDGDDLQPGVEDFVTKVKQAWPHPPCPRLRTA
jgi:S-DNA-T family DNA segregation ATPase FtsK/SpoIIIE